MDKERFEELLQSVKEAAAIERGKIKSSRTFEAKTANRGGFGSGIKESSRQKCGSK